MQNITRFGCHQQSRGDGKAPLYDVLRKNVTKTGLNLLVEADKGGEAFDSQEKRTPIV